MKIKIEIDETDVDEMGKFKRMMQAEKCFSVLFEVDSFCRGILKHGSQLDEDQILGTIREMIEGVDMELYT